MFSTVLSFMYLMLFVSFITSGSLFSQSSIKDIPLPSEEYNRIQTQENSFGETLRNLPLKPQYSDVLNYRNGVFKSGKDTAVAFVIDLEIKGRRLEQCMDILIRLYANYLWNTKQADKIKLPLPGGYWISWKDWKNGSRPAFKGINVHMQKSSEFDDSYPTFQSYLNTVYSESHTQQFYHALEVIKREEVQIGDIVIRKGTKGHAVMIVDLAINDQGELIALIGNGDTPACQFFLLNHKKNKPWIPLDFKNNTLELPLKRKMNWEGLRRFDLLKDD